MQNERHTAMARVNRILHNPHFQDCLGTLAHLEQGRIFCCHGIEHLLSVARLMYLQVLEEGLPLEKDLLYATALLHDIGRAVRYERGQAHAHASLPLAVAILGDSGFCQREIDQICQAIASHNRKDEAVDLLGAVLRCADKASRNCFCCAAREACYWQEQEKNQGVER